MSSNIKRCPKCKHNKSLDEFYTDPSKSNGHVAHCKLCMNGHKNGYNVTLEQYDELYQSQNGVCAICGGVNKDGVRLAVDHNHDSGEIRGLLCRNCNIGLGYLKDSIARLRSAINYLK